LARRALRTIKVCSHCGTGFDAFRAMEQRGRYCSPQCLAGARQASRDSRLRIDEQGPAMIPRLTATADPGAADSAIA
jgi:hypothetical protein